MKGIVRKARLMAAGAAFATAALAIPAVPAHAATSAPATQSAHGQLLSLCLTIRELNINQCIVI